MVTRDCISFKESGQIFRLLYPLKPGPFVPGVFGCVFLARRGADSHEGTEHHRSAEGVHPETGRVSYADGGDQSVDLFNWEKRYGGLLQDEMRRFKLLEDENARQKRIKAELTSRTRDVTGRYPPKAIRPARKRELVGGMLVERGVSIRRACRVLRFDTSCYHNKSHRTGQVALERRINEICATSVRYGCRHIHVLPRQEGGREHQEGPKNLQ